VGKKLRSAVHVVQLYAVLCCLMSALRAKSSDFPSLTSVAAWVHQVTNHPSHAISMQMDVSLDLLS